MVKLSCFRRLKLAPDRRELRFDRQAPCDKWMMVAEKRRKRWRRLENCEI
jgi:hypothetical protein